MPCKRVLSLRDCGRDTWRISSHAESCAMPSQGRHRFAVRYPPDWRQRRKQVLERAGYRCELCGKAGKLECDHRIPIEQGGGHELSNLRCLCRDCHIKATREQNTRPLSPERLAWQRLLEEMK